MTKVLYLHQYFVTNASSGGTRSYEFAKHLAENDFAVHVITGKPVNTETINREEKFTVYSTHTKYANKMSKWRRIAAFIEYSLKALLRGLATKNVDFVFATSTPLTIGLPAVLIAKIKKRKLIFEVRDVWPDIPIELGYITNPLAIRFLKAFELWIYRNSAHIIVLSSGMYRNLINKGVEPKKISVIENLANLYLFDGLSRTFEDRRLQNKFVCIHPGAMGIVNGLDFILDTAKITLPVDPDIVFLLIGEGKQKESLKKRVREEKLYNVIIEDALPKKDIVKVISAANIGIMCVDNKYKILADNSANKFFDFLAAGLPILINYHGWQKEVIEAACCGKGTDNPLDMAREIIQLKTNPQRTKEMACNARRLAEEQYSDLIAKQKLLAVFAELNQNSEAVNPCG